MMGAFAAYLLLNYLGVPYWGALLLAPAIVGGVAIIVETTMLRKIYNLNHIYGWLLTFGLALMVESVFRQIYGVTGHAYAAPAILRGGIDTGFMFIPTYRAAAVVLSLLVCFFTWYGIEKTRLGGYLRAGTENPQLVQAFGINVNRLILWTFVGGSALAGLAGVIAAPIYEVASGMGAHIIIVIFAIVMIGGLGSLGGTIITAILVGIIEAFTQLIYPQAANVVVFFLMAVVLTFRPSGLFGTRK